MADPSAVGEAASDLLPFAHNHVPEKFPSFGITVGFSKYLSSFATVEQAFHAIEDVHRAEGFSLPPAEGVRLSPMVLPTFRLQFDRSFGAALQIGWADGPRDDLRLIGGLVSGRTTRWPGDRISFFAELGGGRYEFKFTRSYGARITPFDGAGGYYELERIVLKGSGSYWTTAGGLTLHAGPRGAIEALVQYVGTDDVSTDAAGAGRVSLNLSGTMIGVSAGFRF
ncbi:MAG: hypothetical protein ACRENJ_08685 [Candidatus Eiseniibacteriota bacterium]